jgi:hypothetical protein
LHLCAVAFFINNIVYGWHMFFYHNIKLTFMKKVCLSTMAAFISLVLFAQEKGADIEVNVNKDKGGGGSFWGSPVLWIVGAAVFIILLVAVSRGSSRQS